MTKQTLPRTLHHVRTLTVALASACALLTTAAVAEAGCEADTDCKGDRTCQSGVCAAPPTLTCDADADCPGDQVCEISACVAPQTDSRPAPTPSPEPVVTQPVVAPQPAMATQQVMSNHPAHAMRGPAVPARGDGETKGILGLTIAGPITLGVAWIATIGITAGLDSDSDLLAMSAIPVVGPWAMIADERTQDYTAPLAVSGVLQLGGLAMLILGVSIRTEVQPPAERRGFGVASVEIAPTAGPDQSGLELKGSF